MSFLFSSPEQKKTRAQIDAEEAFRFSDEKMREVRKTLLHEFYTRFTHGVPAQEVLIALQQEYPDCNVREILDSLIPKPYRPWQEPEYPDGTTIH